MLSLVLLPTIVFSAEYRVEPLNEPAPSDGLSPEVAAQLAPTGHKIMSGTRTLCEVWLAKQWNVNAAFKPSNTLLYPFEFGQFMGVVNYRRKGSDFRGQEIEKGTYTLRFALQPEDGNHVGTSDTRDFFVLLKGADDKQPASLTKESLFKLSAAAAGTTHPAMLSLLAPGKDPSVAVENDEAKEWSILRVGGASKSGAVPLRVVIVGKAAE
jgi:hypothetical protein